MFNARKCSVALVDCVDAIQIQAFGASSGSPAGERVDHPSATGQNTVLETDHFCYGEGLARQIPGLPFFQPVWLDKVSCLCTVAPRCPAACTHWTGSPKSCTGRGLLMCRADLTKSSAVLFVKTLTVVLQSRNQCLKLLKCMSSMGSVRWRTWLQWYCFRVVCSVT